ncbi:hypothetical protein [Dishui lake virophage 1]|nr:hypothetical protein [Dishui lake virophage 1]
MCGATYEGYGHNAQPIYDARCCDDCNALVLIGRLNLREKGDDLYEHIHKTIEKFPSQKHFTWTALKEKVKSFSKSGRSGAKMDFNPVKVVAEASEKRQRDEANQEKERLRRQKEREERTAKLREERERLERIEAERKAKDEEDRKKREEDFERRLKALEIKEQERKEEEKREKERKAKEAEERKAKKEAEKAEKQKKFEGKRK